MGTSITLTILKLVDFFLNLFVKNEARKAQIKADILREALAYQSDSETICRIQQEYDKLIKEIENERENWN